MRSPTLLVQLSLREQKNVIKEKKNRKFVNDFRDSE